MSWLLPMRGWQLTPNILAGKMVVPAPEWAFAPGHAAAEPIFDEDGGKPSIACAGAHVRSAGVQAAQYFHAIN